MAVIVAIGVWALSGQANTNDTSASVKPLASAILTDSAKLNLAFQKVLINGGSASNVLFKPNLKDENNMLSDEELNFYGSKIMRENNEVSNFIYNKNTNFIGSSGKHDATIYLAGVKDSVCKEINTQLYGSSDVPVFPVIPEYRGFITGASNTDPNSSVQIDLSTAPATSSLNWSKGCIRGANASLDNNVYFFILKADID